jgi:hypothetical protein
MNNLPFPFDRGAARLLRANGFINCIYDSVH